MIRPIGCPFLTGVIVRTNSSPGLKESLLHPRLIMSGGLLASATQCTTFPFSSLTSNLSKQWGFAQNQSVTVALTVTFLIGQMRHCRGEREPEPT